MFDPRILKLAEGLVNFSCAVKAGENVLIQSIGGNEDLTRALIKEVYRAGGVPFLWLEDKSLDREILLHCTPEQLERRAKVDAAMMEQMQAFIGIRGGANASELSDVPSEKFNDYAAGVTALRPPHLFPTRPAGDDEPDYREATRRFQRRFVLDILTDCDWHAPTAIARLGVARSHLYNLITAFDLKRPRS